MDQAVDREGPSKDFAEDTNRIGMDRLLRLVPEGTESLIYVNEAFSVTYREDLTRIGVFETACYFATTLSSRLADRNGFKVPALRCSLSAIRDIRAPKPDPATNVSSGLFRARRCEILCAEHKLPPGWLEQNKDQADGVSDMDGRLLLSFTNGNESVLVVQLEPDLLCVSNDKQLLADVMRPANGQRHQSVEHVQSLSTAIRLLSTSPSVWAVRLFSNPPSPEDPTSILSEKSVVDFSDPNAALIAIELRKRDSSEIYIEYGSRGGRDAINQFERMLGKIVRESHVGTLTSPAGGRNTELVLSLRCDLSLAEGGPTLAFIGVATILGYGVLL